MNNSYSSKQSEMEQLIGQTVEHYRITDLLGEGGMGAVFRAQDVTLQREVAIKVMHPHLARQLDFQQRFLQEARAAARLDHPGIVKVYDFGSAESMLFIVMEFIQGRDLRARLDELRASGKWITLTEATGLARELCSAIGYAHEQGILHRDIKPENIMLKPGQTERLPYRPVVTDLGLAKLLQGGMTTQVGISSGTPAYVSPEQALGEPTDARSDVYSLGILLYELTVGQLPFPAKTITEAIRFHTREPLPLPRSLRPDVPEGVQRVIVRALEKDPAARFPTAQAMVAALDAITPGQATIGASAVVANQPDASGVLDTVHQPSMSKPRGESVMAAFARKDAASPQDRIGILSPDGSTRYIAIKPEGLKIGRGEGNDIILDDSQVSRTHAQITFDGANYRVTDLNSTNGSHIANFKLLPGVAEVWVADKPLRIGGYYLRLERSGFRPTSLPEQTAGIIATQSPSGAGGSRVSVLIPTTQFTVAPGSTVTLPLTVMNQGEIVDHFRVTVRGIAKEWLREPEPIIQLLPGMRQQVTLTIQPPRTPQSRAGQYPFTVRVDSQDAPSQKAEVTSTLTVEPFHDLSSELLPEKIRAGRRAQVNVRNQGNAPEMVNLVWRDQADELLFTPANRNLSIREGQEINLWFMATPRQPRWMGSEKQHSFAVQVQPSTGEAKSHTGQVVSYGLIPGWVPPLAMVLVLGLCALLAALALISLIPPRDPPPGIAVQPSVPTTSAPALPVPVTVAPTALPQGVVPPTAAPTPNAGATATANATQTASAQQTIAAQQTATAIARLTAQAANATQTASAQQTIAAQQTATAVAQHTIAAQQTATAIARQKTIAAQQTPRVIYDFVANANKAVWTSGAGALTFGNDVVQKERGIAMFRTIGLNDGSAKHEVLFTHPQFVPNGMVQGVYSNILMNGFTNILQARYVVQSGDHLLGKVGFEVGGVNGNVTFRITIRPSGSGETVILTLPLAYANGVKSFDLALAAYAGKAADFVLRVDAGDSSGQDWAVWQDVKITR